VRYSVTKIEKIASKLVLFWDGSDLVRPITIVKEIDQKNGLIRLLADDGWFEFTIYDITEITDGTTTRMYSALSTTETSPSAYKAKLQSIYQFLVSNILRGCCCDSSDPESSFQLIQYLYNDSTPGSGEINFNSETGKLSMNLVSNLGQNFADLLHHVSEGAWLWLFDQSDTSKYSVYELTNYALSGSNATWDASLKDGEATITNGTALTIVIDNSGSGSISDLQGVIDAGAILDKDNVVDAAGNAFSWSNVTDYYIEANSTIEYLVQSGLLSSDFYMDAGDILLSIQDGAGKSAVFSLMPIGADYSALLQASNGSNYTRIVSYSDKLRVETPSVATGGDPTGKYLKANNSDGDVDYDWPNGQVGLVTGDVSDNSSNVLKDLTGATVPVVSGGVYEFEFFGVYDASTTAVGHRVTINGPAFSFLGYESNYSLSATTQTINRGLSAYQLPVSTNSTSAATSGNTSRMKGIVIPSANGDLQVQFACETNLGSVTYKQGSNLRVTRLA